MREKHTLNVHLFHTLTRTAYVYEGDGTCPLAKSVTCVVVLYVCIDECGYGRCYGNQVNSRKPLWNYLPLHEDMRIGKHPKLIIS